MDKIEFLTRMKFPIEWITWGMYPDELAKLQVPKYEPNHENGSEHDRNGAFHWWLKRNPTKEQLIKLVRLSFLDEDQVMGGDVRQYILLAKNCDEDISKLVEI